jgi:hypothetical protein
MPEMIPVESSAIEAIGYEPDREELYVLFLSSETYIYHGVSPEAFDGIMNAESKGTHLNTIIKPSYPRFHKI